MTQILPGLPAFAPATSAAAKAPEVNGDAWLQELERARWDAQPRYRAGANDTGARPMQQQASHDGDATHAGTTSPEAEAPPARAPQEAQTARSATATPLQVTVPTASFLARAAGQPLTAWMPPVAASERIQQQLLQALRSPARARSGEPWSERNVHVQPEGEAWAVWIRDAGITPERVQDMLDAIAQLAGRAGERPRIRLTVNGQPFAADHAPFPGDRLGN